MSVPLAVIGGSGFGRDVLDVVEAQNRAGEHERIDIVGFVDDAPSERALKRMANRGVDWLGGFERWLVEGGREVRYLIGIADTAVRARMDADLAAAGFETTQAVHPAADMGFGVVLGEGAVVFSGAVLGNEIEVGRHALLNMGSIVGHDSVVGDYVTLNPRATISGCCRVEDRVLLGVGSVVLQGLTVGAGATVGGMACVVRDVPPGLTVKGVPAK